MLARTRLKEPAAAPAAPDDDPVRAPRDGRKDGWQKRKTRPA